MIAAARLTMIREEIRREKARRSLAEFARQAWHVVEPAMMLIDGWHLDAVCDHLEAVTYGWINRLVINIPPGHAKSILVSVIWPAWEWAAVSPAIRSIFSSYALDLAVRDSGRCRDLIESEWFAPFRSHKGVAWSLKDDSNRKDMYSTTATGSRLSLSVGSKGTGFRGDKVVVDDPLNAEDAYSKLKRDEVIRWWDGAMSSRFNDMRVQRRVIIGQRLHEDDLTGHVLRQGGYEHLNLPSEFERSRRCVTFANVPRGEPEKVERVELFRDPREGDGDLLFPALFTPKVLKQARVDLREAGYAAQHQQRPSPADGGTFKKGWWRFHKPDGVRVDEQGVRPDGCYLGPARALPDKFDRIILSLDANFKGVKAKGNDPIVLLVIGCKGADRYVLERIRLFVGFNETLKQMIAVSARWPRARLKLVEEKANGSAIIEQLAGKISGIVGIDPEGGKEARANAFAPEVESGNWYLPDGAPWLDEWIEEFAAFPRGVHDDQVDAASQAAIRLGSSADAARRLRAMSTGLRADREAALVAAQEAERVAALEVENDA